jgi:phage baseplate assembly protein W
MRNIAVPFRFDGGRVGTTTNPDTVARQKIIDVLTTSHYERLGLPSYGAGIRGLLFEPIDSLVEADFKIDAINEVHNRVSGVTIHDIRIKQSDIEESTAEIFVYYSLPLSPIQVLSFVLTETLTEESPL